jgi:hypothetical protein
MHKSMFVLAVMGLVQSAVAQDPSAASQHSVEAQAPATEQPASVEPSPAPEVAPVEAPAAPVAAPAAVTPPAPPAPYSLPWQLRPMAKVKVIRLDDSYDSYSGGTANVLFLNGLYTFESNFQAIVRLGMANNFPTGGKSAFSFLNMAVAGQYLHVDGPLRLAAFVGATVPFGMGAGDSADAAVKATNANGVLVRSAMDNAMFAVNDFTIFPGVSAAYVKGGVTVQWEATVLQLIRVRATDVGQKDAMKTNFTTALHFGVFLIPQLSVGTELRYQRWLSTPAAVAANAAARENLNVALGFRGHFKVGGIWLRPGISFSRGLAGPMAAGDHNVFQFDVPVLF